MNADPSRAGSGGEEDNWESLAEDLFGINLGADQGREPLVVPEDLSFDEPESSPGAAKSDEPEPKPSAERTGTPSTPEPRRGAAEKRAPRPAPSRPAQPRT